MRHKLAFLTLGSFSLFLAVLIIFLTATSTSVLLNDPVRLVALTIPTGKSSFWGVKDRELLATILPTATTLADTKYLIILDFTLLKKEYTTSWNPLEIGIEKGKILSSPLLDDEITAVRTHPNYLLSIYQVNNTYPLGWGVPTLFLFVTFLLLFYFLLITRVKENSRRRENSRRKERLKETFGSSARFTNDYVIKVKIGSNGGVTCPRCQELITILPSTTIGICTGCNLQIQVLRTPLEILDPKVFSEARIIKNTGRDKEVRADTSMTMSTDFTAFAEKYENSRGVLPNGGPLRIRQIVDKSSLLIEAIRAFKPEWKEFKDKYGTYRKTLRFGENSTNRELRRHLEGKGLNLKGEFILPKGDRVDLLWGEEKIIIEAKSDLGYTDPYTVNNLIGKVIPYKEKYPEYKILVVIYGDARQDELSDIHRHCEGVTVVVLGNIRKKGEGIRR